jgi:gluconolactonase
MSDSTFFEVHDPVFSSYVLFNAPVKRLATGFDWAEGPVWFGDADCLLFSDIPNNRIVRWSVETGISTFRQPSNFANGHTRDRQGRLISCEHGGRRVTRTEFDGTITVLADSHDGKRLNSPNDVVVKGDGTVWFTDPHYGIGSNYEGHKGEQEQPCHVYRLDPETSDLRAVITSLECPNGLAFSSDESLLYVADTGTMFAENPTQHMRSFAVNADGSVTDNGIFYTVDVGVADGFRLDTDGNIWTSAGDGVHCISPSGRLLGKILVPEIVSNVCFGGRDRHQLFMTGTTSLYRVPLNCEGLATF